MSAFAPCSVCNSRDAPVKYGLCSVCRLREPLVAWHDDPASAEILCERCARALIPLESIRLRIYSARLRCARCGSKSTLVDTLIEDIEAIRAELGWPIVAITTMCCTLRAAGFTAREVVDVAQRLRAGEIIEHLEGAAP